MLSLNSVLNVDFKIYILRKRIISEYQVNHNTSFLSIKLKYVSYFKMIILSHKILNICKLLNECEIGTAYEFRYTGSKNMHFALADAYFNDRSSPVLSISYYFKLYYTN